jgi:hypothetical protein
MADSGQYARQSRRDFVDELRLVARCPIHLGPGDLPLDELARRATADVTLDQLVFSTVSSRCACND